MDNHVFLGKKGGSFCFFWEKIYGIINVKYTVIFKKECLGLKIKFKVIFWDPVKHANVQISITNNENELVILPTPASCRKV